MEIVNKGTLEATTVRPKLPDQVKSATSADSPSINRTDESRKTPEKKKSHVARNVTLGILGTAMALEGAGATATELTDGDLFLHSPDHTITEQIGHDLRYPLEWIDNIQNKPSENPSNNEGFDLSKLDTKHQAIIVGKNARIATPEEIQSAINSPLPEVNPNPKTVEDLPVMSAILTIDTQKAGKIEMWRTSPPRLVGEETMPVPKNLVISIENGGVSFGVTPAGVNVDDFEIFKLKGMNVFIEKFYIQEKNEYVIQTIAGDCILSDVTEHVPTIDTSQPNWSRDMLRETGLRKTISQDPTPLATNGQKSEINVGIEYVDGFQPITPAMQDGDILIATPNSR